MDGIGWLVLLACFLSSCSPLADEGVREPAPQEDNRRPLAQAGGDAATASIDLPKKAIDIAKRELFESS